MCRDRARHPARGVAWCSSCGPSTPTAAAGALANASSDAAVRAVSRHHATWVQGHWICQRCALAADLDGHLGPVDALAAPLVVLRTAILSADNPTRVRSWLPASTAGQVLATVASGRTALTHAALDGFGADQSVMHLRSLLVAVGALPAEDRSINRFEAFAGEQLDLIDDSTDRGVVRAWLRWQVLPRLRARDEAGTTMAHSANNARRSVRQVVLFLDNAHGQGRTLRACVQADLAPGSAAAAPSAGWPGRSWCGPPPARTWPKACPSRRLQPRPCARSSTPSSAGPSRGAWWTTTPSASTSAVVGALVVLSAQPLARVAVLKSSDVHRSSDGTVVVDLDGNPVPIHEPFSSLIGLLPRRRSNGVSDQLDTPWLFPGRHAGHHCGPVILGERLRAHRGQRRGDTDPRSSWWR